MISLPRWMGASLAIAVIALSSSAQAAERGALPEGSYQVAQASDPGEYALQEQVRQLTGKVEELTFQLLQLEEKIRRMQEDNEFRFKELESKGGGQSQDQGDAGSLAAPDRPKAAQAEPAPRANRVAQAENGSVKRGEPPRNLGTLTIDGSGKVVDGTVDFSQGEIKSAIDGEMVASVSDTQDPEELYREGYKHVLDGDYNLAEGIFRSFVQSYPNDPLLPDARFWLAESLRAQGRLEDAAAAFIAVRKDYPKSIKAPETLLKIGQIMAQLGDRDVACVTFSDAEKSYPKMSDSIRQRIRDERSKAKC